MRNFTKSGLSGSAIKYIAAVMMFIDHVQQMFAAQGAPQWFHWIGRPVLPVFLFMCAEAFWYTRSRARYMLRLFIGFVVMNIGCWALSVCLPVPGVELTNNVFQTLLLATFYMLCVEILRAGLRENNTLKAAGAVGLMLLPIAVALLYVHPLFPSGADVLFFFVPNLLTTEGSFIAVAAGLLFYLFRENRIAQAVIVAALGAASMALGLSYDDRLTLSLGERLLDGTIQWMMIFAIIPILLYNGKRGNANKYFFYVFYPAHIFALYVAAWFIT